MFITLFQSEIISCPLFPEASFRANEIFGFEYFDK